MRLPVTKEAKVKALRALKLRESLPDYKKFGLDKEQAAKEGVASGVERAKQLVRSESIPMEDARKVCSFKRFLNRPKTQRVQGVIDLWGGENYIKRACRHVGRFG